MKTCLYFPGAKSMKYHTFLKEMDGALKSLSEDF